MACRWCGVRRVFLCMFMFQYSPGNTVNNATGFYTLSRLDEVNPKLNLLAHDLREREMEIRQQSVHSTQMRNELASYAHSVADMAPMLKKSKVYTDAAPFLQIKKDVKEFLQKSEKQVMS